MDPFAPSFIVPVVAGTAFLAVVWVILLFSRDQREELRNILETYTTESQEPRRGRTIDSGSFWGRIVAPVIGAFAGVLGSTAPQSMRARAHEKLIMAGSPISVSTYLALRGISLFALPLAFLAYMRASGQSWGGQQILALLAAIALGRLLPDILLKLLIGRRQKAIERSIPDAVDLIVACVEAGLSLDGALMKVAERTTGPLRDEFAQALHEIRMGRPRRGALRDVALRTDVRSLHSLSQTITHAEQMGVSIADVLRQLAEDMRNKRRLRAQEMAQKAPIKMIPVIIICILPALFVVVLGPAVISMNELLGK